MSALWSGSVGDMDGETRRVELRSTFDSAAELYDRARPRYPEALFDAVVDHCELHPGDHVLEVGSGTGIATRPLVDRGLVVTCVELGEAIVAVAQARFAGDAHVHIVHADFETWQPAEAARFDAAIAATAWHWIDPAVGYTKLAALLRQGGHLAVWTASHVFPSGGDDFFVDLQEVYDEIGEGLPSDWTWPSPVELAPPGVEAASNGRFVTTAIERFDWELSYDAQSYVDLLDTFSGHISMQPWQRHKLYGEIRRRLALRPDGRLRRHWGAVLEISRPVDPRPGSRPRD
jgi:SAM-dependent methyltransferase